jgi:ribosomal protein S18 acetylase RimI-like enzyme
MESRDLDRVGQMAGELVRYHHSVDPLRFLLVEGVERGYARFFGSQLTEKDTVLLVAERGDSLVGYAYAGLEPRDWNALRDACGALHDIFVVEDERKKGVAQALLGVVKRELEARGAPRVVLGTMVQNEKAQRLFEKFGFRRTMIEMTMELGSKGE